MSLKRYLFIYQLFLDSRVRETSECVYHQLTLEVLSLGGEVLGNGMVWSFSVESTDQLPEIDYFVEI